MHYIPILLGGFALFIYGMHEMGKGLELIAGNKLQTILEKITSNKYIGVLVGALVTAIAQSSSATTVMAVGFVNSKILTLSQAVNIIMGANIGTTVTGLLLSLNINILASIIAFIGVILLLFVNKRRYKYLGQILFGFGTLFIGMEIMGNAVKPLASHPSFANVLASTTNPFLGVFIGALFTAIVQSSSATTGVLITLANTGLLSFASAFYLILGSNIGTCITSFLSSLGGSKNAKRVAIVHVAFNVIGTIIFSAVSLFAPIVPWIESWTDDIGRQIAFLHVFFNISTTVVLLPFTSQLVYLSKLIVRGEDKVDQEKELIYLNPMGYHDTITTIAGVKKETLRMFEYTKENLDLAIRNVVDFNEELSADIEYNEEIVDFLNKEISKISIKTLGNQLNKAQYKQLSYFIRISSNIERLGDYSYSINSLANQKVMQNVKFTNEARLEILKIAKELQEMFMEVEKILADGEFDMQKIRISAIKIRDLAEINRENSLIRLRKEVASPQAGIMYDKLYTYLLRIRDHLLNVANQYTTIYQ